MKLKRLFIINAVLITGMLILSIWAWRHLPIDSKVPVHFGFTGLPDSYMGREGLLIFPLLAFAITLLTIILAKIEPYQQNLERSSKAYSVVSVGTIAFLSSLHVAAVLSAFGKTIDFTSIVGTLSGLLFIVLGYLSKIRRNSAFGIRTRWTVSSDLVWHKTHRLGSWLTVLLGFACLVSGLLSNAMLLNYSILSLGIVGLVVLPLYSYDLWRTDRNSSTS